VPNICHTLHVVKQQGDVLRYIDKYDLRHAAFERRLDPIPVSVCNTVLVCAWRERERERACERVHALFHKHSYMHA
jgi:hypothetical protein